MQINTSVTWEIKNFWLKIRFHTNPAYIPRGLLANSRADIFLVANELPHENSLSLTFLQIPL